MEAMHMKNYTSSENLLEKSLNILKLSRPSKSIFKLKVVTLNNLGCLYKRTQNYVKALNCLTAALDLGKHLPHDVSNKTATHLNLCAIKSALNDHEEALRHALTALQLLRSSQIENAPSVAVCFHAVGIEYQFLNLPLKAMAFFDQGYEIAAQKLGKTHPLTVNLEVASKDYHGYRGKSRLRSIESYMDDRCEYSAMDIEKKNWKKKEIVTPLRNNKFYPYQQKTFIKSVDTRKEFSVKRSRNRPLEFNLERFSLNEDKEKKSFSNLSVPFVTQRRREKSDLFLSLPKIEEKKSKANVNKYHSKALLENTEGQRATKRVREKSFKNKEVFSKIQESNEETPDKELEFLLNSLQENQDFPNPSQNSDSESKAPSPSESDLELPKSMATEEETKFPLGKSNYSECSSLAKFLEEPEDANVTEIKEDSLSIDSDLQEITVNNEKLDLVENSFGMLDEKLKNFSENCKDIVYNSLEVLSEKSESEFEPNRNYAAIVVQKHVKGWISRNKYRKLLENAVKIQRWLREIKYKKYLSTQVGLKFDFAQQYTENMSKIIEDIRDAGIQTESKSNRIKETVTFSLEFIKPRDKYKSFVKSMVSIQALIRGFLTRIRNKKTLEKIVKIQNAVRTFQIRKIYNSILQAILFIQQEYRKYRKGKKSPSVKIKNLKHK